MRKRLLARHNGDALSAAAELARQLSKGDKSKFKAGYTPVNAILSATETFPEVDESDLAERLGWTPEYEAWKAEIR